MPHCECGCQLLEVSFLLSHGSQEWHSGCQVCLPVPLPAKPTHLPLSYFLIIVCSETLIVLKVLSPAHSRAGSCVDLRPTA